MAAACLSATAQAPVNSATEPLPGDRRSLALDRQIAALVAQPAAARAHWGVIVTRLDGAPIYALNEGKLFHPASYAKLFTTAAAMALLGPDRTFETRVVAKGTLEAGVLMGDLELVGGGDANLSGRVLPYVSPANRPRDGGPAPDPLRYLAQLADQVVAKGLKEVDGDVVGDDTYFAWEPYTPGWAVDDLVWGYGAPVSALSINENQIQVTVTPTATQGHTATVRLTPAIPYYTLDVGTWTGTAKYGRHVSMNRASGSKVLQIGGTIAVDAGADVEEVAIQDPAEYAAMALKGILEARGVEVKGTARVEHRPSWEGDFPTQSRETMDPGFFNGTLSLGCSEMGRPDLGPNETVLATHRSVALGEDVGVTNKVSQNLHAEILLRHLGKSMACFGTTAQGERVVRGFLTERAGIDKDDFVLYDGSGVSGYDLVTPRAVAKLLSFAAHDPKTGAPQPWFAEWKASLPVGGVDGTLEDRFTRPPLKGHVFAKTGTHSEGNALSGYLDCASGQTAIFSILVDDHLPADNADRDTMDKIVAAIAAAE